jgi:hypothetical protein
MSGDKVMDHAAYQQKVKSMTYEQLRYVAQDAQEALRANPDNPNAGYYQDEICYCGQELQRRRQVGCSDHGVWTNQVMELVDRLAEELSNDMTPLAQVRGLLYEALRSPVVQGTIRLAASRVTLPETVQAV